MKKMSSEELSGMNLLPMGNMSEFYAAMLALKAGEGLLITRKEWLQKKPPSAMAAYIEKNYGNQFYISQTPQRDAWVVKRVK